MDEYHRTIKEVEMDKITKEIESMKKEIICLTKRITFKEKLLININKITSE